MWSEPLETSLYLHIAPEVVDMDKAVDERGCPETEHLWLDWSDGPLKPMPWWSSFSTSGGQGDARKANASKGAALFDAAGDEVMSVVTELGSLELPRRRDHHDA